jgi:hypothetical protein
MRQHVAQIHATYERDGRRSLKEKLLKNNATSTMAVKLRRIVKDVLVYEIGGCVRAARV